MSLLALGLNYHSAPLSLREKLAIAGDALPQALAELRALNGVSEAAILSTCNRTELITVGGASQNLTQWLSQRSAVNEQELSAHLFSFEKPQAIQHTLRVAAGLDSMILGEPQILGQMKDAFRAAQSADAIGPVLSRLFQHAFKVAKEVRSETAIGARSVSVAGTAAALTGEIFASLRDKDVLVVGAGDTARLVSEHLHALGQPRITVANRSAQRAQALAAQFQGAACGLDAIAQQLSKADVVVSTVNTDKRLINLAMTKSAFAQRKRKAVLMIDLGVPRNIDPDVSQDEDIYLYTVDDLQAVSEENRRSREDAARDAERIITSGTQDFLQWLDNRQNVDSILLLRQRTQTQAEVLLNKAHAELRKGEDAEDVLAKFSHQLTQQFLHQPSKRLRELDDSQRQAAHQHIDQLFGLSDDE